MVHAENVVVITCISVRQIALPYARMGLLPALKLCIEVLQFCKVLLFTNFTCSLLALRTRFPMQTYFLIQGLKRREQLYFMQNEAQPI